MDSINHPATRFYKIHRFRIAAHGRETHAEIRFSACGVSSPFGRTYAMHFHDASPFELVTDEINILL